MIVVKENKVKELQVVTHSTGKLQGKSLFTRLASQSSHGDDSMNGCVLPKVAHKPNRERRPFRDRARDFPAV